jgi:hypothetical protein
LSGFSNHQAVEILKQTGNVVQLKIIRYLRGLKFQELQEGMANAETPSSPYRFTPTTPLGGNVNDFDLQVKVIHHGNSFPNLKTLSAGVRLNTPRNLKIKTFVS